LIFILTRDDDDEDTDKIGLFLEDWKPLKLMGFLVDNGLLMILSLKVDLIDLCH